MKLKNILTLLLCIAFPILVGALSGYITNSAILGWYANLLKPSFNPPNYLFAPVWTALYLLMGISLYLIWQTYSSKLRSTAIFAFCLQLFLNFCWSIIFFSFKRPDFALIEIILLWVAILYMIISFGRLNAKAAYLQLPYIFWVSFAVLLNEAIWWLNK